MESRNNQTNTPKFKLCQDKYQSHWRLFAIAVSILISFYSANSFGMTNETFQTHEQPTFIVTVKGQGAPLILIPGLMSNASVFDEIADELSHEYQVHVLSVRGFAGTPSTTPFSFDALRAGIFDYINDEISDKPSIIGHSMGGLTAFMLAIEQPDLINKVVSIDGLPFIGPIFTRDNQVTVDMLKPQAENIRAMFTQMSREHMAMNAKQGVYIQATNTADQARVVQMARDSDPATVAEAMYAVMTTDLRRALPLINTPILMLGASGAFMQTEQHAHAEALYRAQFDNVPNATVVMNSQVRHFMMFDDVDWVTHNIQAFLKD